MSVPQGAGAAAAPARRPPRRGGGRSSAAARLVAALGVAASFAGSHGAALRHGRFVSGGEGGGGGGGADGAASVQESRAGGGAVASGAHRGGGGGAAASEHIAEVHTAAGRVAAELAAVDALFADAASADSRRPQFSLDAVLREKAADIDLEEAIRDAHAPAQVVAILRGRHNKSDDGRQDAAQAQSPASAVKTMNTILYRAQERLDQKVVECKEFQQKTTRTSALVKKALAHLGQQLANNARIMTTTMGGIDEASRKAQVLKEQETQQQMAYEQSKKIDKIQFEQREKDLQEAEFMLDMTMCKGALIDQGDDSGGAARATSTSFQACFSEDAPAVADAATSSATADDDSYAPKEIRFSDARLGGVAQKLSSEGQGMLKLALGRMDLAGSESGVEAALSEAGLAGRPQLPELSDHLEDGDEELGDELSAERSFRARARELASAARANRGHGRWVALYELATLSNRSLRQPGPEQLPTVAPARLPEDESKQAQKCVALKPGCGVLHDTFASLWGDLKDLVDDSRSRLHQDDLDWANRRSGINSQLESVAAHKGALQTDLAEVMATKSTLMEEQRAKHEEDVELSTMLSATMSQCKSVVQEIVFSEMASAIRVRNEVVNSMVSGAEVGDVVDCAVSNWIPGPCPVPCDDTLKGGEQVLRREIVVKGNKWGTQCPKLVYKSKCNQIKCPVDCKLGPWSAFSKCTKECDGGVQTRTRLQLQKPRYGGQSCDALQESRACNTGSCDRDCKLGDWTQFTQCSKVCNTGYRERRRQMLMPVRANGECPAQDSPKRREAQACNERPCIGDEVCIQAMDLVIAIDGSGSLTQEGFEVMKTFAAKLVKRFKADAYGRKAAKVGIVQFGNGKLDKDHVVSDAILVSKLSEKFEDVSTKIMAMTWQKGFTNLAQALLKARNTLFSGRTKAEHVVMVLTDGRPSFKTQAQQAVDKLRDAARLVMVHVQAFRKKSGEALLKSFASQPWQTNYIHIPGKEALKSDYDAWVAQAIVEICPRSMSPSRMAKADKLRGYGLVREGVTCGPGDKSTSASTVDDCKAFADQSFADPKRTQPQWAAFAIGGGKCQVYAKPCSKYEVSAPSSVYARIATKLGL